MDPTEPIPDDLAAYNAYIEQMREREYPMLKNAVYLDHAGTTLYSKSLVERYHSDLLGNLYGNPHSASPSSQLSTHEVESVRVELLRFFRADPEFFDLIFTANATAAVKLIGDALHDRDDGFLYGYHTDSHTSLVGLREYATAHRCVESVENANAWIGEQQASRGLNQLVLISYPLQSNMNGRRLPLRWGQEMKQSPRFEELYTLADAAAYASTSQLDLSDVHEAPDFTILSLYKIFGFPDLGALIVKKDTGHLFRKRRYFGGGTVDMVVSLKEQWHIMKSASLHERLEDGTLPIHSIVALKSAIRSHLDLFGTLDHISRHTAELAKHLFENLSSLRHINNQPVCIIHKDPDTRYGDSETQGPTVAFNLRDKHGRCVSNAEVEKLASIRHIHLRTGGVCNPGGIATALLLEPWEMRTNFSAGQRCGGENDIFNGKPTGVIRASLGAMSTRSDVERFLDFIDEFFVDKTPALSETVVPFVESAAGEYYVESLTIYPIKSCGGWSIPYDQPWEARPEGLVWDREWCIIHQGTGKALSQKQHPRMALIRPSLDFKTGELAVNVKGFTDAVRIPLSRDPNVYAEPIRELNASVCDDAMKMLVYVSPAIADFFTKAVGVPCTLARFNPNTGIGRYSKAHLQPSNRHGCLSRVPRPILLSNESPILTISRSSLNRLNEQIKEKGGKAALPSVFRPNIVLAENHLVMPGQEHPWAEDLWQNMRIGGAEGPLLEFLGGCRRCQMVCVDQDSAEKNAEPFVTLAKTRRFQGSVLFGVHTTLVDGSGAHSFIKVGDIVDTSSSEENV